MRQFTIKENLASTNEIKLPPAREFIPPTSRAKLKEGYQVIMVDPKTDEIRSLTEPNHFKPTENSHRRFARLGTENIYILHSRCFKDTSRRKRTQDIKNNFTP
jgi:hypothetical protein